MGERENRREQIRCLGRLLSQCRVNSAQAAACGRGHEEVAWREIGDALEDFTRFVVARGLPVQLRLNMNQ